ncbi:16S rRNA (uracil(1498)-N(3))-methyltransferase [Dyadobacter sp. CY312]|uniref:RsmE family RNA methyltransferase n=1 Tax=Dyadobacter sp. CY312 TaxID=2907303 RepID=UPI001F37DC74|nr:RsmE family RNA methyltransferase [Dyadobacter sp. CY312]MCE7038914.1 16S rRNA (uracil(1498)-N(3))-methyltransferase [Dyadobacter sp. CY312]
MHLFYQPDIRIMELDDEEARHCTKVLRLSSGDIIHVTNGQGLLQKCSLDTHGKKIRYKVIDSEIKPRRSYGVHMAIAPTRKAERNEWMVEKMIELGVESIDFIVTGNTVKESLNRVVNMSRLGKIAAAAMKQSQQYYMPEITLNLNFNAFIESRKDAAKLIAYVPDNHLVKHVLHVTPRDSETTLLIGPEGDFTAAEVEFALNNGFQTVSLGATRLRTETAAVAGCHAINLANLTAL